MYVLKYLNARSHMAALGIQSMFLPTSYGGASIEWVNSASHPDPSCLTFRQHFHQL